MSKILQNAQNMSSIIDGYKDIVAQYKNFGYDLLNIKNELQFYLSAIPVVFLVGGFVHLYIYRKAHMKIAQLQGQKEAMRKQLEFYKGLVQKHIEKNNGKVQNSEQVTQQKSSQQQNWQNLKTKLTKPVIKDLIFHSKNNQEQYQD